MHIAVGQHRARHGLNGARDPVTANLRPIHSGDGPAVHGQKIDLVPGEERQERVPVGIVTETYPGLDRERHPRHDLAEGSQDGINSMRFAQQSPAGTLAVHDGRGAPQIEIHGSHRILLQLPRGLG